MAFQVASPVSTSETTSFAHDHLATSPLLRPIMQRQLAIYVYNVAKQALRDGARVRGRGFSKVEIAQEILKCMSILPPRFARFYVSNKGFNDAEFACYMANQALNLGEPE